MYLCVCKLRAEIIVMTGRIVNAGVIHAVIMSLLLVLLWFDRINIHLDVNWQAINQYDQNAAAFMVYEK